MEDLRFVAGLVEKFFEDKTIKKKLRFIRESRISGWEKWMQVEFGMFLDGHTEVMQADREQKFAVDGRKTYKTRAHIDFVFRKKNCAIDQLLGVELKRRNSFHTCLAGMIEDANKFYTLKGKDLRGAYCLGIHTEKDQDYVINTVWEQCREILPSKQRIISRQISDTDYSYTIF